MLLPLLLASGLAHASVNYPATLRSELGMPCSAACTACHATNTGGAGTVTQPFGEAMMDRGLLGGGQVALLTAALDAMATDAVDSDGDGELDVDQLAAGGNPNGGDAFCGDDALPTPKYGCFNQAPGGFGLVAIGAAMVLARRRRGR